MIGANGLTGVCDQFGSTLCGVPLWFVCSWLGWNCVLLLGSVALLWQRGLRKLEKFVAEVILGFWPCSSRISRNVNIYDDLIVTLHLFAM
jgi:hypothetical protein